MLCSAPFNSILIDVNKQVRPCCIYTGSYTGNLAESTISEIMNSDAAKELQSQMLADVWPAGCMSCKTREEKTGTSPRINVYGVGNFPIDGTLRYLEYNTTNTCNLACVMCTPAYSSTWVQIDEALGGVFKGSKWGPVYKIHPASTRFVEKFIKDTDFTNLDTLWFKGGEPFLNKEIPILLEHLHSIGVLQNIKIVLTTNGTIVNNEMLRYFSLAKSVQCLISIDGSEEVNKWIRFHVQDYELSGLANVEHTIAQLAKLKNIDRIVCSCAVQVYNIFDLHNLVDWWDNKIIPLFPSVKIPPVSFSNFVLQPPQLSCSVLRDETRASLIEFYKGFDSYKYNTVVKYLELPSPEKSIHDRFVSTTHTMNSIRPKHIEDIVPELVNELKPR